MNLPPESEIDDEDMQSEEKSIAWYRRRRQVARKRLSKVLGRIDHTEEFLRMIWCMDQIGEGNYRPLKFFTIRPKEVVDWLKQPHRIHKWTLETLLNAYLRTKPLRKRGGESFRTLNARHLASPIQLINLASELENADDGLALQRLSVFGELHRLAQRQFHWQRGKANKAAFFKAAYLFTFPEANDYFTEKYGVSVHDFCATGFAIYALLKSNPAIQAKLNPKDFFLNAETLHKCMAMYARSEEELRKLASNLPQVTDHSAYQASILRTWPCVLIPKNDIILGPIPDLVVERFTNGLYYDFVGSDGNFRNLCAKRFESYCRLLLREFLQDLTVEPEFKYGKRGQHSPDAFLLSKGETAVVIECKAKKAPIAVKLGEEPDLLKDPSLNEIVKGAFQIWRFFSHVRRGIVKPPGGRFVPGATGLVVSMDSWLEASPNQQNVVLDRARELCAEKDPEITAEDQVPVAYCSVDDLELLLANSTDKNFLRTLTEAAKPKRAGWHLVGIHDEISPDETIDKGDPLEGYYHDIIKWWPQKR